MLEYVLLAMSESLSICAADSPFYKEVLLGNKASVVLFAILALLSR